MRIEHTLRVSRRIGIPSLFLAAAFAQTPNYTIKTIAGNGTVPGAWTGDAGPAAQAELNVPTSAVIDSGGHLYIADSANHRVRYVDTNGTITTAAGTGVAGFFGDSGTSGADGKAGDAELNTPSGVVLDTQGNLYIADTVNNVIRKVTPAGVITTVAGLNSYTGNSFNGDGASATLAAMNRPSGMVYDSSGNLYIADTKNNAIRKVTAATGNISTVAGTGSPVGLYGGDNGPAVKATLNNPVAIALDGSGNLYIADTGNNVIRKVSGGTITTVAGNGTAGFTSDGVQATATQLSHPKGIALDGSGNLFISDTNNSRIRVVTSDGVIHTVAGNGGFAYGGDGGLATSAALNFPSQISIDSKGNIYVADTNNNVIRQLTPLSGTGGGNGGALPAISSGGVVTLSDFGRAPAAAPGSWVEIYGSNLAADGDTRSWAAGDFTNGGQNAPLSLDRTSVTIAGQQAYIYYISPGQVDALLPNITAGTQQLTVTTAAGTSTSYPVTVSTSQFAVYAPARFAVGGSQYAGAVFSDGTFVMPANSVSGITSRPAHAGETITLFGIGFGDTTNGLQPGQLSAGLTTLKGTVQVLFGTTPVTPSYAGFAPGNFGLYQINVVVPAIPASNLVPLTITLNGAKNSQTLFTAVQ